jgi:hypothetical protein
MDVEKTGAAHPLSINARIKEALLIPKETASERGFVSY